MKATFDWVTTTDYLPTPTRSERVRVLASKIGCEFLDLVERRKNIKLEHIHFNDDGSCVGEEPSNLVPGRNFKPDGYHLATKTVYEFHGNYYHGYPPDHPKHETLGVSGRPGPELYQSTMDRMKLFKDEGYTVQYAWGHEYSEYTSGTRLFDNLVHEL